MTTRTTVNHYPKAYGAEYQAREAAARAEREAEEAERQRQNDAAKARIQAGIAAEKAERAAQEQARIEAALAPAKERLKRTWLAEHPESTAADFEARAWPRLRLNLIDDDRREAREAAVARLRGTGQYSL